MKLSERLERNGRHADVCDLKYRPASKRPCSCYLSAAIEQAREYEKALEEAVERSYNPFEPDNQADFYKRWKALTGPTGGTQ